MSIGEGNALSEHEATVLQTLEIVSRQQPEWIKASELRKQAAPRCPVGFLK